MEPKDQNIQTIWQYVGISITAGGIYFLKFIIEKISKKIKSNKKSKDNSSETITGIKKNNPNKNKSESNFLDYHRSHFDINLESLEGVHFSDIHLKPNSPYIRQSEIISRLDIVMEDSLRIASSDELYEAIKNHIDFSKKLNLESVKIEIPHHSFLNSSSINAIIRICQYIRDYNGIRLVIMISPLSESCQKLFHSLKKLVDTWDSGRIEIYIKSIKDKLNYEDYKKFGENYGKK